MAIKTETVINKMFGIQTAMAGGNTLLEPSVLKICITNKKVNVKKIPMPSAMPVPPRLLRDDMATANSVNTKNENGDAIRL